MNLKKAFKSLLIDISDLQDFFGFDYVIIGGLAVGMWGHIRATKDIDILADIKSDILNGFTEKLKAKGYKVGIRRGDVFDPIPLMLRITIPEGKGGPTVADMLIITRDWEKEILKNKRQFKYEDISVNLISVEDLILIKLRSSSPIDEFDARELFLINKDEIDHELLKRRAKMMNVDKKLTRFLKGLSDNP